MKKILLLIAHKGFQPVEFYATKEALEKVGFEVMSASNGLGIAYPAYDGDPVNIDIPIEMVRIEDFEGVFIIGGPGTLENLDNSHTHHLIQEAAGQDKAYGAICIAPRILAKIGVLAGKKATGWDGDDGLAGIFEVAGAKYVQKSVVTDGKLVTASGPEAAQQFGRAIAKVVATKK